MQGLRRHHRLQWAVMICSLLLPLTAVAGPALPNPGLSGCGMVVCHCHCCSLAASPSAISHRLRLAAARVCRAFQPTSSPPRLRGYRLSAGSAKPGAETVHSRHLSSAQEFSPVFPVTRQFFSPRDARSSFMVPAPPNDHCLSKPGRGRGSASPKPRNGRSKMSLKAY